MSYISINQDALQIILETGVSLATATSVAVRYKKPDGTIGSWTGTVSGTTIIKTMTVGSDELICNSY